MGNPSLYYKRALQYFSHCLACEDKNRKLAKELCEEESDDRLEKYILEKKKKMSEKLFYYDAGRTSQSVFDEANEEGCDAFNACCGGIYEFEHLIGLNRKSE